MVEEKSDRYNFSKEDKKFFEDFTNKHFGPSFNFSEFSKLLNEKPRKLLLDTLIFLVHPKVNKYAGRFIKKNNLDERVKELREEFKDIFGRFKKKLSDEERTKYYDYWYTKELVKTFVFLLIFTISNNMREKEQVSMSDYSFKIISQTNLDEKLYKPVLEILQFLSTYGDIYEFYASAYMNDFEFLFGNYIEPINSEICPKKTRFQSRHLQINNVLNYEEKKYEKFFEAMDSDLRNALAHKSYFVDEEVNKIRYMNYKEGLKEINLNQLEDKSFRLKIINYMLVLSEEYLLKPNNIAFNHIKSIAREFICNPRYFLESWNAIIIAIADIMDKEPKNKAYSILLRKLNKFLLTNFVVVILQSLNLYGLIGLEFIIQFSAQLYNLLDGKLVQKEEGIFINNMEISFESIKIPEDKNLEHEIKKYILLIILTFIESKPKGMSNIKKLYDRLRTNSEE